MGCNLSGNPHLHESALSQMLVDGDEDFGFTLLGFNEEEVAQGVSIIKTMFQQYISQDPIPQPSVLHPPRIRGSRCDNTVPTYDQLTPEPDLLHASVPLRQQGSLEVPKMIPIATAIVSPQNPYSIPVLPMEKTPEPEVPIPVPL